jgi:hypothetical protein
MRNFLTQSKAGFSMLFTVLVISIILTIGLGIADTTFRETILSSTASDSQLAFYQADSGVECGLYWDGKGQFMNSTTINTPDDPNGTAPSQLTCGDNTVALDIPDSRTGYLIYKENVSDNTPCYAITFDDDTDPTVNTVSSRGYSTCSTTPRQVERGLSVSFANPVSAPAPAPADPGLPPSNPPQ